MTYQYSTEEQLTDQIWIDGSPIYNKVLVVKSPGNPTRWENVASITGMKKLLPQSCMTIWNARYNAEESVPNGSCRFAQNNEIIQMYVSNGDYQYQDTTIIAYYTKSTTHHLA